MIYAHVKRATDVVLAVLIMTVMAPVALVVAILVRLSSPGPVFFRQQRVGRFGKLFSLLKFRSMRTGSGGPDITVRGDKRVTRVGAFLRRSKLDELPQLINVLVGDMSLVGPRPEVPQYVAIYPEELKAKILSVRPGITDLASIDFIDEESILSTSDDPQKSYVEEILPQKLAICSDYVDRQSFKLDLTILFRTLSAIVFRGKMEKPVPHRAERP